MTASYTHGPWQFAETWRPAIGTIDHGDRDANGNVFWGYHITGSNEHGGSILPDLAAVHNFPDNCLANARLIASAPDLLDALLNVRKLISEAAMTGFNWKDGDWADRLFFSQQKTSAAIDKAKGRG